jgi:hypothetical protein
MGRRDDPVVKSRKGEDWTKITFTPDFERFGMEVGRVYLA